MSGKLLNFSTTVAVEKTMAEIQRALATAGARSILLEYDKAHAPSSLAFLIDTRFGERGYRLPARTDAVWRVLTAQWQRGRVARRFTTKEQASRVAWRIVKDWLEAQLALIEAEIATLDEIMLPYMLADGQQTVYELMVARQLSLPPGRETTGEGRR